jgi:hypothetical protein
MSKIGKIAKIDFKTEWSGANGKLYFHDVTFEGDASPWNIGAREKLPSKLGVGATIAYEIKDEKKRSIKQVKLEGAQGAPTQITYSAPGGSNAKIGLIVGAALNNAVLLVAHGRVDPGVKPISDTIASVARRLAQIALDLEEEFKSK